MQANITCSNAVGQIVLRTYPASRHYTSRSDNGTPDAPSSSSLFGTAPDHDTIIEEHFGDLWAGRIAYS